MKAQSQVLIISAVHYRSADAAAALVYKPALASWFRHNE